MDNSVAKFAVTTVEQQLGEQTAGRRFQMSLISLFSFVALLLSAIGIYGLMHYFMLQRTNEIGVRMALGASPGNVLALVLRQRLKDQRAGLRIDYSLTLLRANSAQAIPASGGDRWMDDVGRCATRTSAGQVELGCLAPGNMPCVTLSLEYAGMGQAPVQGPGCCSDYAPCFERVNGDSISRFAREFRLVGSQLKDARVVIKAYRPEAHFTRQVVIPDVKLSDWRPE